MCRLRGRGVRSAVALTFAPCVLLPRLVDDYPSTDVMPRQNILALPWHLPVTCTPSLWSQRRRMPHALRSGTPRPVRMLVQPGMRGGGGVRGGRKHLRQTIGHPPSRNFLRNLCLLSRLRVGGPEHLARHAVHHHRASPCENSRTHARDIVVPPTTETENGPQCTTTSHAPTRTACKVVHCGSLSLWTYVHTATYLANVAPRCPGA